MKATELMEQTEGDVNICIAVLDGPVDLTHPCFSKAKITKLESLVSDIAENGPSAHHGTHVASLIFGQRDSPIRGVSPGCRGLVIPVFADGPNDSVAPCSQIDLAHAITKAVEQGAHVINISGGELEPSGEPHPLLARAVRLCAESNVLIVAAAGNDGCPCLHVPASVSSTLAVGAMDAQGLPLDFSNWGQMYQNNGVLALGDKLLGAVPCEVATKTCGVDTKSGTSFATPIVTGIAALLLSIQRQRGGKPDPHAVREAILQSARPCLPSEGLDCSRYLRGRLNIEGAYNLVTKKQQKATDCNNSIPQIQESAGIGLVESSKNLPFFGVQNSEFTIFNPEIVAPSTQISTLDAMKALEYPDSIELSIENNQAKNQIPEDKMTENIEVPCGCPRKKNVEETNELDKQKNNLTVSQVLASEVQVAEPTITNQEAAKPSVVPSQIPTTQSEDKLSLVYTIGKLGYDFGSEARRDSFVQNMDEDFPNEGDSPNPDDPVQLLHLLDGNPEYAESLIWTLEIEGTPVYAIRPAGSFSSATYKRLCEFLRDQHDKGVDIVSIPGVISGKTRLFSGQIVPVILPELRGMTSWCKESLVKAAFDHAIKGTNDRTDRSRIESGVHNFLERVYYELMNLGRTSSERAMNFAGTNAFQVAVVFEKAIGDKMALDSIETERSPICRPDSDCWDVKLKFFDPEHRQDIARKVYRFTVDVSDVMPVTVGEVRSWSIY
jgi:cyanobactin maturation PatA/PatG family protease